MSMIQNIFYFSIFTLAVYSVFDAIYFTGSLFIPRSPTSEPQASIAPTEVTVQIPIYNTGSNIIPLLESIHKKDVHYPVHLLDTSNDHTTKIIEDFFGSNAVTSCYQDYWIKRWGNVSLIHFNRKLGFKAWSLQNGMSLVETSYTAVFDADWEIEPAFFTNLIPLLKVDPKVGFAQASWKSINETENLVSYIDAVSIETEHLIEDTFRNHFKIPFTIHGSAFIARTSLLKNLQWRDQFLSEDIDMALRMSLNGYRGIYFEPQKCHGRTCRTLHEFFKQKCRWIEGRSQMLRVHFSQILKSPFLSWPKKIFLIHYLSYFIRLPLLLLSFMFAAFLGKYFLKIFTIIAVTNLLSKAMMNLKVVLMKERKKYLASILEPILFWLFIPYFSFRSVRGFFLIRANW